MYYIWKHTVDGSTKFFTCGIEEFEGWRRIGWLSGKKIEKTLPQILHYLTSSKKMKPEDFPRTGGTQFLISKKIANIIKRINPDNIDYYDSDIIRPDGVILKDYYTINILNVLDCTDWNKTDFEIEKLGPAEIIKFNKLILDVDKIPINNKLFRLYKSETILIAHESIKEAFEKENVIGVHFIPISEYRDY